MPPWTQLLAVTVGGAVGSVTRFVAGFFFAQWFGTTFPWATLFVNVVGSMWLGFFGTLALAKPGVIGPEMRLLLTTGFAGGFTTFSTLTFETLALYQAGQLKLALANVAANFVVGFAFAVAGIFIARLV